MCTYAPFAQVRVRERRVQRNRLVGVGDRVRQLIELKVGGRALRQHVAVLRQLRCGLRVRSHGLGVGLVHKQRVRFVLELHRLALQGVRSGLPLDGSPTLCVWIFSKVAFAYGIAPIKYDSKLPRSRID
jgi:hypothetical protein